ncbi:MAG: deoxyribose-phosphate aldolase [bacterium]
MSIAQYIDHTLLKPDATESQIGHLCCEARNYGFAAVCVNPIWVELCAGLLAETDVKVCAVVGFPFGANCPEAKAYEARLAVQQGASEIDMVINIGALKSRALELVERDIRVVRQAVPKAVLKVIIETRLLTDNQKIIACQLAQKAGADFVKTSTGFSTAGATIEDVALMRRIVGPNMGVKASGGINALTDARAMINAGANRLGCSASVAIVREEKEESDPR